MALHKLSNDVYGHHAMHVVLPVPCPCTACVHRAERRCCPRYLLRLGMGEQELATSEDFSRVGRVNAMLTRRLELLAEVEKMARQVGRQGQGALGQCNSQVVVCCAQCCWSAGPPAPSIIAYKPHATLCCAAVALPWPALCLDHALLCSICRSSPMWHIATTYLALHARAT
jgi:hypothetical protein